MNDFTKKYAELISRYVDIDDMEHFHEDFEELLDAYENGDDETAKVIHRDATPDKICDVLKSAFDKKREEHERRHQSQAVPVNWSIEKQRAYNDLIKLEDLEKIKQAAKAFVDICKREEQARELSSEDFECLLKLADSVRRKMFPDHVCDEEKHESPKPESEKPEANEIYCDVFGNRYFILAVLDNFPDCDSVKEPFVILARMVGNNLNEAYTLPLEDFFNPAFVKE